MTREITYEDLVRIFGPDFIPAEIDRKILMKHFNIIVNRIIGKRTVEKIKEALLLAIETAKTEQQRERGKVLDSPVDRLSPTISVKPTAFSKQQEAAVRKEPESKGKEKEDKYGLNSIRKGLVTQRLAKSAIKEGEEKKPSFEKKSTPQKSLAVEKESALPSIEELTVLSGGRLSRDTTASSEHSKVKREVAIREYKAVDEGRSVRWGKESVVNGKGQLQEINQPAYIFHSDLWQLERAREPNPALQCGILSHVILDMVANNINVVMLEEESEPFFVVEGQGLLYSKDTLKDKVKIQEIIHLMLISCEAWQIALKRPEALLKGRDAYGHERLHQIDMTSVIPLTDIRQEIAKLDSEFKKHFDKPDTIITKAFRILQNHRKNIIWTCGAPIIGNLRMAMKEHRRALQKDDYSVNIVVVGTKEALHPVQVRYNLSGDLTINELYPGYCKRHSILTKKMLRNIFGSIPVIYDSKNNSEDDLPKIAHAVRQRVAYSAQENLFDPSYIRGNPSDMVPISKLDIILPPKDVEIERKLERAGFILD